MPERLQRVHASIGRAAEYFSVAELEKQTGQGRSQFAAMSLKELTDNALDACETAGVSPEITIAAMPADDTLTLTIGDNGPGLPPEIVTRILDFESRTSDKLIYTAPMRGAQGNALKTVLGLPVALGGNEPIVIESCGVRHEIAAHVDAAGHALVAHEIGESATTQGTAISLTIPRDGQQLDARQWARGFAVLNPHASISLDGEVAPALVAHPRPWRKWLPSDATSIHWYSGETLRRLVAVLVAESKRNDRPAPLLRDFVRQFAGLTGTAKAKLVTDQLPTAKRLDDLDDDAVETLLAVMHAEAKPVPPQALGLVGKETIRARFDAWYAIKGDRFWYAKALGDDDDGLPYALEVAVAETEIAAPVVFGLNFSPAYTDPFSDHWLFDSTHTHLTATGVVGFLERAHVVPSARRDENGTPRASAALVHLVHPAVRLTDRGKSRIDRHGGVSIAFALAEALGKTSKVLWTEGERRRKDAAKQQRREDAAAKALNKMYGEQRLTLVEAGFLVMEQAYAQASGDGALPAGARSIFYQARPLMQRYTDEEITDTYFTQTILPRYQREVRELPNVYYEPRGTLYEPHTGVSLLLGTRGVEWYTFPSWTYDKILFVEKKGLWPLLQAAQLAERYDMAIIAGEGFAPVAARVLLERADKEQQFKIFVVHDGDPKGINIARTLQAETDRMPGYSVKVIDLGLMLDDALAMGLEMETFTRTTALDKKILPILTPTERAAFTGTFSHTNAKGKRVYVCQRVELNAMSSPQFVGYIEDGLEWRKATEKIVPPEDVVRSEAESSARERLGSLTREEIERLLAVNALVEQFMDSDTATEMVCQAAEDVTPDAVREKLEEDRILWWKNVAKNLGKAPIDEQHDEIIAAIETMLADNESSP